MTYRNSPKPYSSRILSRLLCSALQLKDTKYFVYDEDNDVPELMSYIGEILSCDSIFKVAKIIQESLPGIYDIEQDLVTPNLVLGRLYAGITDWIKVCLTPFYQKNE